MSFLQRVQSSSFSQARRASTPGPLDEFWYRSAPFSVSTSGVRLSPEVSLTLSAVWQAVGLHSDGVASVPCHLFRRRLDGRGRDRVSGGELGALEYRLRWQPNDNLTAFQMWQYAERCVMLRGIFIAEILAGPRGFADKLMPIHPDRVTPKRVPSGRIVYEVRDGALRRQLSQDEVFVIMGPTDDCLRPMSFIEYGAQELGITVAASRMAGTFFDKGVMPALAVSDPNELGPDGLKNLHDSIALYIQGSKNAFGILPLEYGTKIEKLGLTPADSQLLLTLDNGVENVARWTNTPLHMLRMSKLGTSSYASLEVFSAEFVTYGLRPKFVRNEQAIQRDLILAKDLFFAEFNMEALLRGNLDARAKFYQSAVLTGYMSRNEVREKENMNPVDGLDRYLEPQNMAQIDESGDRIVSGGGSSARAEASRARVLSYQLSTRQAFCAFALANETAMRLVRREKEAVEKLAKQHANDPDGWKAGLQEFYQKHAGVVAATVRVPMDQALAYAGQRGEALVSKGLAAFDEPVAAEQYAVWALDMADAA